MSVTDRNVCEKCSRVLDEYRAEIRALRTVLKAVEATKHKSGAMVEMNSSDKGVQWVVTSASAGSQRLMAEALAEYIAKELGKAVRLTHILFTGSDADAEEAALKTDQPT